MMDERLIAVVDELLRRLAAAIKAVHLYSPDHPIVGRSYAHLGDVVERLLMELPEIGIAIVDQQLVVNAEAALPSAAVSDVRDRLAAVGIERMIISRGVTRLELGAFVRQLPMSVAQKPGDEPPPIETSEHIRITRLRVQQRTDEGPGDMRAVRQAYADAVVRVEQLWQESVDGGRPDPALASDIVEGLAQLVSQNRRAVIALTALCQYDNYTFTHMVNVGVLTMAQARTMGIEGALLRQFGLAGLMHDIGKIRVPSEILTKPSALTDPEFAIMRKHPADGADILRRQIEMPPLVAVVAFEHHLRLDGTGYPDGVRRPVLNLATQLCSIADVYDAMRSQRAYQQTFPTERILAVLQSQDYHRFDQQLVRRFSQLMGIYPPGTLVRLDDGALAVVVKVHAPDPARPVVRVITDSAGVPMDPPLDLALWATVTDGRPAPRIVTPVNPATVGIDPLPFLDNAPA